MYGNQLQGQEDAGEISQDISHVGTARTDIPNCQNSELTFRVVGPRGINSKPSRKYHDQGTRETMREKVRIWRKKHRQRTDLIKLINERN